MKIENGNFYVLHTICLSLEWSDNWISSNIICDRIFMALWRVDALWIYFPFKLRVHNTSIFVRIECAVCTKTVYFCFCFCMLYATCKSLSSGFLLLVFSFLFWFIKCRTICVFQYFILSRNSLRFHIIFFYSLHRAHSASRPHKCCIKTVS